MTINNDINSLYPTMIYAPYIPLEIANKKMTWREFLRGFEHWDRVTEMDEINKYMQERFPGPYRVVEKYDPKRIVVGLGIEFDDPKKEMMWRIENG